MKKAQASSIPPSTELVLTCARAAIDKKANHSLIFEVGKLGAFTEYFLITGGSNSRQVRAIADAIHRLGKDSNMGSARMEGFDEGRWVLIDFGNVVIHVFDDAIREFYDLESLWNGAPRLRIPEEYYTSPSAAASSHA